MSEELRSTSLLEQIRQILSRRRRIVVLALAVPITGAVGLASFAPRSYRSSAVVIVERGPGVSDDDVDARLSALRSENLRRSRLGALVERFNLYRGMERRSSAERRNSAELLIDQMQKDVRIDLDKEERGGRSIVIAVHVTYAASSPQLAADVANDLASFYEREDLRMREQRAGNTRSKLQEQLADARQRLDEQETRLKDYKMHHLSELPEQVGLHLSAFE
jgi:succinoglycan biosynthesis transport protein ExoP